MKTTASLSSFTRASLKRPPLRARKFSLKPMSNAWYPSTSSGRSPFKRLTRLFTALHSWHFHTSSVEFPLALSALITTYMREEHFWSLHAQHFLVGRDIASALAGSTDTLYREGVPSYCVTSEPFMQLLKNNVFEQCRFISGRFCIKSLTVRPKGGEGGGWGEGFRKVSQNSCKNIRNLGQIYPKNPNFLSKDPTRANSKIYKS